ncbi:unnamed protein product, partial [Iphiclides podalirius]
MRVASRPRTQTPLAAADFSRAVSRAPKGVYARKNINLSARECKENWFPKGRGERRRECCSVPPRVPAPALGSVRRDACTRQSSAHSAAALLRVWTRLRYSMVPQTLLDLYIRSRFERSRKYPLTV